jgi:hypothetical protein
MKHFQIRLTVIVASLFSAIPTHAQQPKSLFYLTREPKSVRSFLAHADKIDILVPQLVLHRCQRSCLRRP